MYAVSASDVLMPDLWRNVDAGIPGGVRGVVFRDLQPPE